ncbi:MAG TPA: diacylglycerol kinase [Candidatus Magasanikbacteria bacterium]|nr:diacylglycerol kinase [Candidatus Magasanikbacteria bacterium]
MNFLRLIKSFKEAIQGVAYVFKHEQNFRIQVVISLLVLIFVWFFELSKAEMIVIFLLIILVLILELLNSAVEKLSDVLKPRLSLQIGVVKDIMAGMVFLSSLGAVVIGLIIFWPHLFEFIERIW